MDDATKAAKLELLRGRLAAVAESVFKKDPILVAIIQHSAVLDICLRNIEMSTSGNKIAFKFYPEKKTTYNASTKTLMMLTRRLVTSLSSVRGRRDRGIQMPSEDAVNRAFRSEYSMGAATKSPGKRTHEDSEEEVDQDEEDDEEVDEEDDEEVDEEDDEEVNEEDDSEDQEDDLPTAKPHRITPLSRPSGRPAKMRALASFSGPVPGPVRRRGPNVSVSVASPAATSQRHSGPVNPVVAVAPPGLPQAAAAAHGTQEDTVSMLTGEALANVLSMLRDKDRQIADKDRQIADLISNVIAMSGVIVEGPSAAAAALPDSDPELFTGAHALMDMARG